VCHSVITVDGWDTSAFLLAWRPRSVPAGAAWFSRSVVARVGVSHKARAKALLWNCAQLGAFAESVGLELDPEVLFGEAVIERFLALGCRSFSPGTTRTLRTNLRFVAKQLAAANSPAPAALPRERSKCPYSSSEIAGYLALADAQPTEARRQRANGLICLGAGAGLTGIDLRAVRGIDVVVRSGGVVVCVRAGRPRVVPVLAHLAERAIAAGRFAGAEFIVGGVEPTRRNVTSGLIASLSGGFDLPRLEIPRLRATWLSSVGALIGLPTFLAAAGITCSQRLGDVMQSLEPAEEAEAVALLGGLG
jgi:hypothetical protein